jgi:hypothetical protein
LTVMTMMTIMTVMTVKWMTVIFEIGKSLRDCTKVTCAHALEIFDASIHAH